MTTLFNMMALDFSSGHSSAKSVVMSSAYSSANTDVVFVRNNDNAEPVIQTMTESKPSSETVAEAIVQFQEHVQNLRRELEFSFDEQSRRVIITVHDADTGDVVRQIPSEEFIKMARHLQETESSAIFDNEA